jgi:hypothetical protein
MSEPGLEFVTRRTVVSGPIEVRFPLRPGDRAFVAPGDVLVPGSRIADRLRDPRLVEVHGGPVPEESRPGDRWTHAAPAGGLQLRRGQADSTGELLFELGGHWRMAAGEHPEQVDTPVAGVVRDVRPGIGIGVRAEGRVIHGIEALGEPTRGVLAINPEPADGGPGIRLKAGSLDVGLAGAILIVGSRVDAETLTRARAMGLRGIVVSGLAGKERRDFLASEGRQRASLHRLPTFAVLVLEGAVRRRIASPVSDVFAAIAGREVAIVTDPPALVFNEPGIDLPAPAADLVRVRAGERAGREGHWAGLAGLRRYADGTFLEAGWVRFETGTPVPIPLADLERFG